jgi:hypothetical protein
MCVHIMTKAAKWEEIVRIHFEILVALLVLNSVILLAEGLVEY